ncbi:DUF3489 domain-containing protein [Aestuariivirga sp.]|uniref:DUF3489 domain-containing protein n=1 Tax=Aestuariivirga sp. TaxID=2650926 RepID=UPI003593341F
MSKTTKPKSKKASSVKSKTKAEQVFSLLARPAGASIAEMMKSTSWQAHSVRGFLAGSLKKKGHTVSSELDQGGVRRYRLATAVEA